MRPGWHNQYRTKTARPAPTSVGPLLDQAGAAPAPARVQCCRVWGHNYASCRVLVGPPGWYHDSHRPGIGERWLTAQAPDTLPAVLGMLAADTEKMVRYEVASNRSTPPGALEVLLGDPDSSVRQAAATNPNLSAPALAARRAANS